MSLIKKTIILSDMRTDGYMTVVRVGDEVGAKIVGASFTSNMFAFIRVGNNPVKRVTLAGAKTEILLDCVFNQSDSLGCRVTDKSGTDIAKGGVYVPVEIADESGSQPINASVVSAVENSADDNNSVVNAGGEPTIETVAAKSNLVNNVNGETVVETVAEESIPVNNAGEEYTKSNVEDNSRIANASGEPTAVENSAEDNNHVFTGGETAASFLNRLGKNGNGFYRDSREQIEELFIIYPTEDRLEAVVPNSKWVRINYDGDDYYVVGKLMENGKVTFIGYGVPGLKRVEPPKITGGFADWLPLENFNGFEGYWLIFQDAQSGKIANL